MADTPPPWPVKLHKGGPATSSSCVYPDPAALEGVELSGTFVLTGPGGAKKLVGAKRVDGPQIATAVWVTPELLATIASGTAGPAAATLRPARRRDRLQLMGRDAWFKVATALFVLLAAIAAAGINFATRKIPIGAALGLLILVAIAALLTARNALREATTPKC